MSKQKKTRAIVQRIFFTSLLNLLLACGGGGGSGTNNTSDLQGNNNITTGTQLELSGSVGDGPITGATITITAADGTILATTVSDSNANYRVTVPDNGAFPYIISAASGIDMVTGTAPTFTMVSVARHPSEPVANINPFSTLIVKTAQAIPGGLTSTNIDLANQNIIEQLNFGLDTTLVPRPGSTTITTQNVAAIAKASETLAEMIRRTRSSLQATGNTASEDYIINALAADMTDGFLDGMGASGAQPQVAAIVNIVSGQVIIEALSNNLKVNGVWATDLLDNAIRVSMPGAVATTADVRVTEEVLTQAKAAIAAAQAIAPSAALTDVAAILETLFPDTAPATIETVLSPDLSDSLNDATTLAVSATTSQMTSINTAGNQKRKNTPPKVSLTADPATVAYNGTTTLSWSSSNAVSCSAIGGWTSTHATSGSVTVGPLTANTTYSINCINVNSQITSASVSVTVGNPPPVVTDPTPVDGGNDPVPGDTTDDPAPMVDPAPTETSYDLYLSLSADRANSGMLEGATVSGNIYIYSGPESGVARVSFFLDDPDMNGAPLTIEKYAPYDLVSTVSGGNAAPFNTSSLADGQHNITVLIELTSGTNKVIRSDFNVANNNEIAQNTLTLTWSPNPDNILGYVVYYGPTADTATTQVSDIPVDMPGFDPANPSVEYLTKDDLGLVTGDNTCFRLKAYNSDGLSGWSPAVCSVI